LLFGDLNGGLINFGLGHHVIIKLAHLLDMRLIKVNFLIIKNGIAKDLLILLFHPISIIDKRCPHK
jgi:hypothetical protein